MCHNRSATKSFCRQAQQKKRRQHFTGTLQQAPKPEAKSPSAPALPQPDCST